MYVKESSGEDLLIIWLYVDDIFVTGSNIRDIESLKKNMEVEFEMTKSRKIELFPRHGV